MGDPKKESSHHRQPGLSESEYPEITVVNWESGLQFEIMQVVGQTWPPAPLILPGFGCFR